MMRSVHKVTKPADLDRPNEIIWKMLRATCWRADLSHGDELRFHIGERLPYSQPSMAGREKGAWMLGTRESAWRIESQTGTLVSSEEDPRVLKQKLQHVEGTAIITFTIGYPDLSLTMNFSKPSALYALKVFPNTESEVDLPYWELFTPNRMLLKVGPGAVWAYISADHPESC